MSTDSNRKRPLNPIFRAEMFSERNKGDLGSIRLAQPISAWWITTGSLLIGVAFISFIIGGSVTKKSRIAGITVPVAGSLSMVAPSAGVLITSTFNEGDYVHAGQALFELSTERQVSTGEVSEIVSRQLTTEERSLDEQQRLRVAQNRERRELLQQRLESLTAETKQVNQELALAQRRYHLAERGLSQYESLQVVGFMSSAQTQQKQEELLDLAARISNVGRKSFSCNRADVRSRRSYGGLKQVWQAIFLRSRAPSRA